MNVGYDVIIKTIYYHYNSMPVLCPPSLAENYHPSCHPMNFDTYHFKNIKMVGSYYACRADGSQMIA